MQTTSSHDIVAAPHDDVTIARARVAWLDDAAIDRLGAREPGVAVALALLTGGGGHLYVGDRLRGFALVAGYALALALLAPGQALVALAALGTVAALDAHARARRITQYREAQRRASDAVSPVHPSERLLAAARSVQPHAFPSPTSTALGAPVHGPFADLADRLRKLAALRTSAVIDAAQYADRKLELLQSARPADDAALEDLLLVLVRLEQEGVVTRGDVTFVRDLGVHA